MPISNFHRFAAVDPPRFSEDIDSTCSTPFVSAPSSPTHIPSGYFFSAPASPMHYLLSNNKNVNDEPAVFLSSDSGSFEFEFSSRFSPTGSGKGSMTSADELFVNGQIRPMKLSSHLQRPHDIIGGQFLDLEICDSANVRGRDLNSNGSIRGGGGAHHRKARSMSPFREWQGFREIAEVNEMKETESSNETTPSCSASSSRSSSSGRNSKKWLFLKDLLHRSKSEGSREKNKERFWTGISIIPVKEKRATTTASSSTPVLSPSASRDEKKGKKVSGTGKPANGVWKRRGPAPSAHELHYTAKRAQAEEMKRKTFLPYREGLFGCLGFSSKSYGAFSGFTKNLNPISSR